MKKQRWAMQAFHTLEAALILPVVFILTAGLIYLGFMMHDMLVLKGLTADFSQAAAVYVAQPQQMDGKMDPERFPKGFTGFQYEELAEDTLREYSALLLDQADKKTLIYQPYEAHIQQSGKTVTAQVGGSFPLRLLKLVPGSSEAYVSEATQDTGLKAAELLRISRGFFVKLGEELHED